MKVAILDYGVGNLFSVKRALEFCGADEICITSDRDIILNSDKLILPGVGAFGNAMTALTESNLTSVVKEYAKSGKYLLGVCLGMQLLGTKSFEFGEHQGLNLIPGEIIKIPTKVKNNLRRKVPFVGWSPIIQNSYNAPTLLDNLKKDDYIYLVHSYQFICSNPSNVLAMYDYEGELIPAAIQKDNITGLQFHPEKSGEVGLSILKRFLSIV